MSKWTLALSLLAVAGALAGFYIGFRALRKARAIQDTPTAVIRSAPQGYVELEGWLTADQAPLTTPLSGTACLWYRCRVHQFELSGHGLGWHQISSEVSDHSFFIEDGTGQCHIHPEGADITGAKKKVWYGHDEGYSASGYQQSGFLDLITNTNSVTYRYTEEILTQGQVVYALGLFQSIQADSFREQAKDKMRDLLTTWKRDHNALLARFDANGDGKISQAEWDQARREAAKQAKSYVTDHYDGTAVNILAKPPRGQQFLISTKSPERLIHHYRLKSGLFMLVFLLCLGFLGHTLAGVFA